MSVAEASVANNIWTINEKFKTRATCTHCPYLCGFSVIMISDEGRRVDEHADTIIIIIGGSLVFNF